MYIKGVGSTKFGILDKPSQLLAYEASMEALGDMSIKDIDCIVLANLNFKKNGERQRHYPAVISSLLKTNVPIISTPAACATGGAAIWTANRLGFDNVLVIGVEKLASNTTAHITDEFMMATESKWEQNEGLNFPAQAALVCQMYMKRSGVGISDLTSVALKNHANAFLNPKARFFGKKVSKSDIENSPVVASPLRLMDCSITVDGASAVVLSKDKSDVSIIGSSLKTDCMPVFEREHMDRFMATRLAAEDAYKQAGVSASDVDVAELHDAFTPLEIMSYEDLGFAKEGKGFISEAKLDGKLPVNCSGGLKAKGHPISATGVGQIVELCEQLRGECGDRQVSGAKIGLAQNIGGVGGTVTVNILRRV